MLIQFKAGLVPAALQIKALAVALGIVFLAEGLLILTMHPAGQLSVIGLLVGISLLFSGFDLLRFGLPVESHPRDTDAARR